MMKECDINTHDIFGYGAHTESIGSPGLCTHVVVDVGDRKTEEEVETTKFFG